MPFIVPSEASFIIDVRKAEEVVVMPRRLADCDMAAIAAPWFIWSCVTPLAVPEPDMVMSIGWVVRRLLIMK